MMDDLIRRSDAIDALGERPLAWTQSEYETGLQNQYDCDVEAIQNVLPAQQWIPCSELLPEKEGQYLVTLDFEWGKEIEMGDWFIFEDGHGEWVNPNSHVTVAWMPLPEAWKGEGEMH